MKGLKYLSQTLIVGTLALGVGVPVTINQAEAIQFADGTTSFGVPFRLRSVRTSQESVRFRGPTYFFTFNFPKTATEPLHRVRILQLAGTPVEFNDTKTFAYLNQESDQRLRLHPVTVNPDTQEINIVFDPPVPPGNTVTIAVGPFENPAVSGIYQFGLTAYPPGNKPRSQFLGYGPLRFFDAR